jgi:NAD(P)-dependent dehydrogenase (short-subunit alcohol dehydrogenase family)
VKSAFEFNQAVSLVTGAGGGIGASIAQSLALRGAIVVVTDIEPDAAQATVDRIAGAGGTATARRLDVTDSSAVDALADEVYDTFGRVEVLVNNAGVTMRPFRAVWDASMADFEWMMRVNYFGVVNGLRAFVPRMRAAGRRAHIVNTSSLATLDEAPGHAMYTASKAAVDGLSEVLRAEFVEQGDDIGVTILYPGQVTTRIATSERLREEADRSENRAVRAYQRKSAPRAHNEPLEPELVGDMVIAAIERDLPCVLTHPAPLETLRRRITDWEAGYLGAPVQSLT